MRKDKLTLKEWSAHDFQVSTVARARQIGWMPSLQWTRKSPKIVGWYWVRDSRKRRREEEESYGRHDGTSPGAVHIVFVRNYAGRLAVDNSVLPHRNQEWAGPISLPKERSKS